MKPIVKDCIDLLRRIADGDVVPKCIGPTFREVYAGTVHYECDGWVIDVYNDFDEWDYIERWQSPSGKVLTVDDFPDCGEPECLFSWANPAGYMDMINAFVNAR